MKQTYGSGIEVKYSMKIFYFHLMFNFVRYYFLFQFLVTNFINFIDFNFLI